MIYAPYMFPLNVIKINMFQSFTERKSLTESLIIDSIRELSSNSVAGPFGIPCSLLLNCAHELAPSLLNLFNKPLQLSGNRTTPSNYRPISLTSVIIKVFERIICKQIVAFLISKGYSAWV